jgi:hypothetical protein
MIYFIFLKSLESLEDFRLIPLSKFLPNLLVQNFKALPNSKIQFKIQKEIIPLFQPEQPNWPSSPFHPSPLGRPDHLHFTWASASWPFQPTPAPSSPSSSKPLPPPRARASVRHHARWPPHPPLLLPEADAAPPLALPFPHH